MNCLLNLISLITGLIGTIVLAFALNNYLKAFNSSFNALEKGIEGLADYLNNQTRNAAIFTGLDIIRKNGQKKAKTLTWIGIILIIISFILQIAKLFDCCSVQ
jgi:hypothetical protein